MKQRLCYLLLACLVFFWGLLIVLKFPHVKIARHFLGDVLVVIFLYACVKIIFPLLNPLKLGIGIFLYACVIEFLQLFKLHEYVGLKAKSLVIALTLGTTFDWFDILAYVIGVLLVMLFD